jgi:hypothetical protein
VELAIAEEKAKAAKVNDAEAFGKVPQGSEGIRTVPTESQEPNPASNGNEARIKELERENLDLKIANRGKDFLIEKMQEERNGFFDQLLIANRKMGELETKLFQLKSPL